LKEKEKWRSLKTLKKEKQVKRKGSLGEPSGKQNISFTFSLLQPKKLEDALWRWA
jgi:hypothetical protein